MATFDEWVKRKQEELRGKQGNYAFSVQEDLQKQTQEKSSSYAATRTGGFDSWIRAKQHELRNKGYTSPYSPYSAPQKNENEAVPFSNDPEYLEKLNRYNDLAKQADFSSLSKAGESKRNTGFLHTLTEILPDSWLPGDDVYDYINDIDNYRIEHKTGRSDWLALEKPVSEMTDEEKSRYLREGVAQANYGKNDVSYNDYDQMTGQQIGIYNYLYATSGKDAAQEYLEYLKPELSQKRFSKEQSAYKEIAKQQPVLASAASVGSTLFGFPAYLENAAQYISKAWDKDAQLNPYGNLQSIAAARGTIRGQVSTDLEENTLDIFGWNPVSFLYNNIMSFADSLATAQFGKLGGAVLGGSAANDTMQDALQRGATDGQALFLGALAGTFEDLFETWSIGNFEAMKAIPKSGFKNGVLNVLKSMGVNATEEMGTEIANIFVDALAMGSGSNWERSVNAYISQGDSQEKAKWKAFFDNFLQVVEAGASGALMGAGFSGAAWAGNRMRAGGEARSIVRSGSAQDVAQVIGERRGGEESDPLMQLAAQVAKSEQAKAGDVRRLFMADYGAQYDQARREGKDPQSIDDYLLALAGEVAQRQMQRQNNTTATAQAEQKAVQAPAKQAAIPAQAQSQMQKAALQAPQAQQQEVSAPAAEVRAVQKEETATDNTTGEGVTVSGIEALEDGQLFVSTANGDTVYLNDITFDNEAVDELYTSAQSMDTTEGAKALVNSYDGSMPVSEYVTGFMRLYGAARSGQSLENAVKNNALAVEGMSPALREIAYAAGQNAGRIGTQEQAKPTGGGVVHEYTRKLSTRQKRSIEAIDTVAKALGRTVHVVDSRSLDASGKVQVSRDGEGNINGMFDPATNEYTISLDSVDTSYLYVAVHESVHDIAANNREGFADLAELTVELLREKGYNVDADADVEELIANTVPVILRDRATMDEFVSRIVGADVDTRNAFEKLLDRVLAILEDAYNALKKEKSWQAMQLLEDDREALAQMREAYFTALEGVRGKEGSGKSEVKLSPVDKYYERQIAQWDGKDHGGSFRVGRPSAALLYIGMPDSDIWFDQSKAAKQLNDKQEITKDVLQAIPELLENPIAISESYDNTVLVFGKLFDERHNPIVVAVRINSVNRRNKISLVNKVRSVGARSHNLDKLLSEDAILYLSENKNETRKWFNALGRSTPFGGTKAGYIRSISGFSPSVKDSSGVKFSLKDTANVDMAALEEENAGMREAVSAMQEIVATVKGQEVSEAAIDTLAKRILNETGSRYDLNTLKDNLGKLLNYMAKADAIVWEDVMTQGAGMFKAVLQESQKLDNTLYEQYAPVRKYLHDKKIRLTEGQLAEVERHMGSYRAYRQAMFGRTVITAKADVDLDSVWSELSDMAPNLFPAGTNTNDMPMVLMQSMDSIRPTYKSPYGFGTDEAAIDLLFTTYDRYLSLPEVAKANTGMAELKKRYQEKIDEVRKVARQDKEEYKAKLEARTLRKQIDARAKVLARWLRQPTAKKHVPDALAKAVYDVLDTTSAVLQKGREKTLDAAQWRERLMKLSTLLERAQNAGVVDGEDVVLYVDEQLFPSIDAFLEETRALKSEADIDNDLLADVKYILDTTYKSVRNANTLLVNGRRVYIETLGQQAIAEADAQPDRKKVSAWVSDNLALLNTDHLTPVYFFEKIGGVFKRLYDEMVAGSYKSGLDAQRVKAFYDAAYEEYNAEKWLDDKKKLSLVTQAGQKIELTRQQALSLYALAKREKANEKTQGAKHLSQGGFVFTKDAKGQEIADKRRHPLGEADMQKIENWLTEEQKAFADALVGFMSRDLAARGNKTSLLLYGYKQFTEPYYFPYKTSEQYSDTTLNNQKQGKGDTNTRRVLSKGFTKATVQNANSPIVLEDFTKVFSDHAAQMIAFANMAIPQENMLRVLNYDYKGAKLAQADVNQSSSVKQALARAYGEKVENYIVQLLNNIGGGASQDYRNNPLSKLSGRAKKAMVAMSASVVIQQPSAIVRAMAIVDPKYFVNMPKKGSFEEAMKYAGTAALKRIGGFDAGTGKGIADYIVKQPEKGFKRAWENTNDLPQKMDEMTWGMIWVAVKKEILAKNPGLKANSREHLEKAAQRFNYVIDRTQVYDSVLSKSGLMRNEVWSAVTAFMAEPTLTWNMAVNAAGKHNVFKNKSRVYASLLGSIVFNNALAALVYAMRDEDEDETYWEKWAQSLTRSMLDDVNPLSYIPVAKDIVSIAQGYDVERMDMSLLTDVINSGVKIFDWLFITDRAELREKDEKAYWKKWYDLSRDLVGSAANLFGIPLSNIERDAGALVRTVAQWLNKGRSNTTTGRSFWYAIQQELPLVGFDAGSTSQKIRYEKLYYGILAGDSEYSAEMQKRLTESGKTRDDIDEGLKTQLWEHDIRIREAAQATIAGNKKERDRIYYELKGEGFSHNAIIKAINYGVTKLGSKNTQAEEDEYKDKDMYAYADLRYAMEAGREEDAKAYVKAFLEMGKEEKNIRSSMTSYYKPLYIEANELKDTDEMKRIREMLLSLDIGYENSDFKDWLKK